MRRRLVVPPLAAAALAALAVAVGAVPFGHVRGERTKPLDPSPSTVTARPPGAAVIQTVADPDRMRLSGLSPETAPVRNEGGTRWVSANDVARLLGASKFWRADLRRFEVRAHGHRVLLIADNPFALVDDRTVLLEPAPRTFGGVLHVPIGLLRALPADTTLARLVFSPGRQVVVQVPATGIVGSPVLADREGETVVAFPCDRPDEVVVASRSRAHFRVRLDGFFVGALRESFAGGLVRGARAIPTAGGCAFEFDVAPEAAGFRVASDRAAGRLTIEFARALEPGVEPFAPEAHGPRPLGVVVLDPGHGGSDAGVRSGGAIEKDLTLAFARALKAELERRTSAHVLLTRGDGEGPSGAARAEFANRARADLVLSIHFDGLPAGVGRGVTAYAPPATFAANDAPARRGAGEIAMQPWRDVATRHAVTSRALAESVLSLLELRNQGPARLREVLPYALLGVNAPGLLIECATLTSEADRTRVTDPAGMQALAVTIADGIIAYARGE